MARHLYKINDGDVHLVAADSKEQASRAFVSRIGCSSVEEYIKHHEVDEYTIEQISDSEDVKIYDENLETTVIKKAKQWASEDLFYVSGIY